MIDYKYEEKQLKSVANNEYENRKLKELKRNYNMIGDLLIYMGKLTGREEDKSVSFDETKFILLQNKLKFIENDLYAEMREMETMIETGKQIQEPGETDKNIKKIIKAHIKELKNIESAHKLATKQISKGKIETKYGKVKIKDYNKEGSNDLRKEFCNMVEGLEERNHGRTYEERQYNARKLKSNFKNFLEAKIDLEVDRKVEL